MPHETHTRQTNSGAVQALRSKPALLQRLREERQKRPGNPVLVDADYKNVHVFRKELTGLQDGKEEEP